MPFYIDKNIRVVREYYWPVVWTVANGVKMRLRIFQMKLRMIVRVGTNITSKLKQWIEAGRRDGISSYHQIPSFNNLSSERQFTRDISNLSAIFYILNM